MNAENTIRNTYDRFFGGEQNLGPMERAVSTGLGLIMAAGGVRRADVPGAIMGLAGAALVARGMSGHCPMKAMIEGDGHHGLPDMGSPMGGDGREHLRDESYGHDDTRLRTYS